MTPEQVKAVALGSAVGDALGVPVEFELRSALERDPVMDMRGFGSFHVPAGAWSDDTSMSLCMLDSLAGGKYDPDDVMQRFARWLYGSEYTPTGKTFDVGGICGQAIDNFYKRKMPAAACGLSDERSNGNGSLMRIYPLALFLADRDMPLDEKLALIHSCSALTHAHPRSMLGCGIYSFVLWALLERPCRDSVREGLRRAAEYYAESEFRDELEAYGRILPELRPLSRDEVRGSGYVVQTLEAALWCLMDSDSFGTCLLTAVNLGEDTDTVASVAGGLAGLLYGLGAIPAGWLKTLLRRDYIEELCERAFPRGK